MARDDGFVRYTLRIPEELYARVQRAAGVKSVNAEIVGALEEKYPAPAPQPELLASLRAVLPFAESRAEDMIEIAEEAEAESRATAADAREDAEKAVAAVDDAKALLASLGAEG